MTAGAKERVLPRMPDFPLFYRALNGRDPFPWQSRLARQVAETGNWSDEIGVPTGLGKTACLDIAIWWLASQAHLLPIERTAPTRIWWVVNRRLLVDSTFEHAQRIRKRLVNSRNCSSGGSGNSEQAIAAVAQRLCSLSARESAVPLEVIQLRGGVARGRPVDPSQPVVLLSTVPMYGSRLLFRGYGTSASMRPVDAALAGTDSLVLLDEAHLARHLPKLLRDLAECAPVRSCVLSPMRARPTLVSLTATGDASGSTRFDLEREDRTHHEVRKRLEAAKLMEIRRFDKGDLPKLLAEATRELMRESRQPAAFLVFANQPKTARAVFDRLKNQGGSEAAAHVVLLTGRTREVEAERIRERVLDDKRGMAASRNRSLARDRHLVVIATQTLEVGADVDAEYLVTEACGVRALTQRLGRLNRLGRYPDARAIYIHLPSKIKGTDSEWPVYRTEPATVLERLEKACGKNARIINMSPNRISEVLGSPGDDSGRAPEILPGLLWEWLKTTTPPEGEAPVEPYFSGIAGPAYAVALIWRVHVPEVGDRIWPRPRDVETVDVPIHEVREALNSDDVRRLASNGLTVESCRARDLRPGDQVILTADRGLLDEYGWNPDSTQPVFDMSLRTRGLPLDEEALERLCGISVRGLIRVALGEGAEDEEIEQSVRRQAVRQLVKAAKAVNAPIGWSEDEWHAFMSGLDHKVRAPSKEVPRLVVRTGPIDNSVRLDEFDEMSLASVAVDLVSHGQSVARLASKIAAGLGVSHELQEVLECAGELHDIGKADMRFQRWLDPSRRHKGVLLAKSDSPRHLWERDRQQAGWPRGGRHEALSARLAERWLDNGSDWGDARLRKLLLHLVISHHGKGRPLVLPVEDPTVGTVREEIAGESYEVNASLRVADWGQPTRFRWLNREFGPWGLALLEAILRQADHVVSSGAQ